MNVPDLTLADLLQPDWRVAPQVRALVTTRNGGVSLPPYGRIARGCVGSQASMSPRGFSRCMARKS
jgi:copper oxidase (laccase) domain-containing protein